MKKLLTSCIALLLVFSSALIFTGCKKDNSKTKIEFDKGVYSCTIDEDSFTVNEELTQAEIDDYLDSVSDFDVTYSSMEEYAESLQEENGNTYIKINDYSIQMYSYDITEDYFDEQCITFDTYTFKNNKLSFNNPLGIKFSINKNEDNSLTLTIKESYNFDFENEDMKTVYSVDINLTLSTEAAPILLPTPELNFYQDKTILNKYELTSISDFTECYNEYKDLFVLLGIDNSQEFVKYMTQNSKTTLILFNDFTMYYEGGVDMSSIFNDSIFGDMGIGLDISVRTGYIYSYEPGEGNSYKAIYDEISEMFNFEILNNGANIKVTMTDWLSDTTYCLNFTKVVETPQQ